MPGGNISKKHYNTTTENENIAFVRFGMGFFILSKPDVTGSPERWRMLPSDFPKWQLVYYYYKKWSDTEQFDLLLEQLRGKVRLKLRQNVDPSLGIVDSQSVRWGNNRSLNGFDGNKKIKGIKRHVIVDKNGFLIAVMVSIANVHDSKAILLLIQVLKEMLCGIKIILADGGYRGETIAEVKKKFGYLIQVALRSDKFEKTSNQFIKDGSLNELLLGSTTTAGYVGIMSF